MAEQITEVPEGFKLTEIGVLPEEWEVARLGEVAKCGGRQKRRTISTEPLIPFVPMALLPEDAIYISQWEMRQTSAIGSGVFIQDGDLLLAKITPCLENGRQGIVRGLPGACGYATTEVILIRVSDRLGPEYLAFYLKLPDIRQSLASKMEGTTGRQRLPKSVVESLLFPLPPLPEQRAIAHVLRAVQQARKTTEFVIQATRELKRSLMRHLFTYGPVPVGEADKVPLKDTEIGPMPEEWEVARLGEVARTTSGGTPSRKVEQYYGGDIPWVKFGELDDNVIYLTEEYLSAEGLANSSAKTVPEGTLLIAMYGATAGKTAILGIPAALNQAICAITPLHNSFESTYMKEYLIYVREDILKERYGGAQPNLGQTTLKAFPVPLPPLPEQRRIAHILAAVDQKIEVEQKRQAALQALFQTLLHLLMTGQVRVKDLSLEVK